METIVDLIMPLAASPWIYTAVIVLVVVDGVFPLFPSEVIVVSLAALATSSGAPDLVLLLLVAAMGAVLGDNVAFAIGRACRRAGLDGRRFRPLARFLDWAERGLDRRPSTLFLTARFIPMARLAVNVTAGMQGYSYARFAPLCILASSVWAAYNLTIGYAAGRWLGDNPVLAMAMAIVAAITVGMLFDLAVDRVRKA